MAHLQGAAETAEPADAATGTGEAMNCDAAQRRLLCEDRLDRLAEDVRRHLDGCPPCRLLGRRLAQAERQIRLLPAPPPSSAKDAFVQRFRRSAPLVVLHRPIPWSTPPKERGLRKLSLAVAIAAVLAVFAIGLGSLPRHFEPPARPAPAWLVQAQQINSSATTRSPHRASTSKGCPPWRRTYGIRREP